jgi:ubiquinone/menaquinone biosynthesis C-methylase UbiE
MSSQDAAFAGSIPQIYDECLVPVLFTPFAQDIARAAAAVVPHDDVLEIAAGTGAVTASLAMSLPKAKIVATDLNADMIARGQALHELPNVRWQVADAQALPFADKSFDLIVCQFGVMFFPDRIGAYREMKRVLRPGGPLLFNVWDALDANPGSDAVHRALAHTLPEPKPGFLARTPFGHHDRRVIEEELAAAGFRDSTIEAVRLFSPPGSAARLLRGLTEGSPLKGEIAQHEATVREVALARAMAELEALEVAGPLAMTALRVTASA